MTSASSPVRTVKTENLMLEEPAFRTRIASAIASPDRFAAARPTGARNERCDCARGESRDQRIRAAGQNNWYTCAEDDACSVRTREKRQALRQHVAGLEIRHHQHVGPSCDGRLDILDFGGLGADRV